MIKRKNIFFLWEIFCLSFFFSCSLDYETQINADSYTPEFVFTNLTLHRYEKEKLSIELQAELMEQYKGNAASFAKQSEFTTWTSDGNLDTMGMCKLISINSNEKLYTLFGDIHIYNEGEKVNIEADNLRYNGKNEQLTSGKTESVHIFKDDLDLTGLDFSASGVSHSYTFAGKVQGIMQTNDSEAEHAE